MSLLPPKFPGLEKLDRELFTKSFKVPTITFQERHSKNLTSIMKNLKKFLIKVEKFHPVSNGTIHMNPDLVRGWDDLPRDELKKLEIDSSAFEFKDVEFTYQNWRADELVKAITPEGFEPATSFSKIGHIIHINLKDNLLTFRNFQIDLLAGDADYQVQLKENGVNFEFDFSTVYWNSRLSTEHERLVKLLNPNDVFYDVFAGVGPFAVPAGKKRVQVLANDLNPHSFKWLEHNVAKNKVANYVKTFNKDGREFILGSKNVKRT